MEIPNNSKWRMIFFILVIAGILLKIYDSSDGGYLLGVAGGIAVRNFVLTFEKQVPNEVEQK